MKNIPLAFITGLLLVLLFQGCKMKNHLITEEDLLGEWYTVKGDVQAYSFRKDDNTYIFTGIIGMHPVIYGTWKIDKKKFIITMDNGVKVTYDFVLYNDTLSFNNGQEIYTRTSPIEENNPEVEILTELSSKFSSLKFSDPRPANLNWRFRTDNSLPSRNNFLKGFSISSETAVTSNLISEISNFLKDSGFEQDTVFITENCIGFIIDNQIVTVSTTIDPEAKFDLVYIQIISSLISK